MSVLKSEIAAILTSRLSSYNEIHNDIHMDFGTFEAVRSVEFLNGAYAAGGAEGINKVIQDLEDTFYDWWERIAS
jgi:hypothetical protein